MFRLFGLSDRNRPQPKYIQFDMRMTKKRAEKQFIFVLIRGFI